MSEFRTSRSGSQEPAIVAGYADAAKTRGADTHKSLLDRAIANIRLLIGGVLIGGAFVTAFYFIQWLALVTVRSGWFPPTFCVGGFGFSIWAILWHWRRSYRKQEARRAYLRDTLSGMDCL